MQQGDAIPAVTVTTANDEKLALGDLAGPLVVYFYPKDDTSGCTREAQDFTALAGDFESAGVRVIGISKDSPARHRKFSEKYTLAVELVSDEDGAACEAFGVWGEKKLYGKTYMGIERATFLFGRDGTLVQSWRKVKVPGHAEAVLEAARAL
ncbi:MULTISPECIES: peroxiredoxin [Sphingomonas]|uniref:thioredoxin-dependent peroxiredoxin n=1 Tax=Sphingomonas parapaucimobilis NBRC 15100 TaxID=1219049 RepID=A0A0A1W9N6_9SPHN|nr:MULTISPECIES: peroxiredoxin [Sphingomonas]OMJ33235.1 peroxiredoxin [Sphingomonas sp. Sph1(2015)]GAM02180.1 putative peroxiredoxin [Sphingomonas parapaucimobilis NBRC 15100]